MILAFAPTLAHMIPGDERVHRGLAFLVVSAGLPSFLGGVRKHRKVQVLVAGFAGMGMILVALVLGDRFSSHAAEVTVTCAGSLLLSTAHLVNRTFCRGCSHCGH